MSIPHINPHAGFSKLSSELYARACRVLPDGVSRATIDRDPYPDYIGWGRGAYLYDVDGSGYLDLNNNFTTLLHGHGFEPVIDAVSRIIKDGTCFSGPTIHEIKLAELLCERIPAVETVRFVNTGTEAVMFAIKAARAATGRPAIAKIEGAYHGAYDWAEVGQTGTPETWGEADNPVSLRHYPGQPHTVLDEVVLLRFNDAEGATRRIAENSHRLACVLIDPMPSRAGLLAPDPEFIQAVVATSKKHGVLVVADEVLNLRQSYRGASARFGLDADLIAMGKIIGGGFPIGAIGGTETAMAVFNGAGGAAKLSQAGTFSANPLSMAAGFASMTAMTETHYQRLEGLGNELRRRLKHSIDHHGAPFSVTGSASLFRLHPRPEPPRDFREAYLLSEQAHIMRRLGRYFKQRRIILPYAAAACLSTPMDEPEIEMIAEVFDDALASQEFIA